MRRVAYAVGALVAAFGAYLVLTTAGSGLFSAALWFGGGIAVHDGLIAPLVLVIGAVVLRVVPGAARAPVQAAMMITGALVLATLPLVLGGGRDPAVPSQQPLAYGRNLVVVLLIVWLVAGAVALLRTRSPGQSLRRSARPEQPGLEVGG